MFRDFLEMFSGDTPPPSELLVLPPIGRFTLILITVSLYGLIVSMTYLFTHRENLHSRGYALTLVVLPPIVTIIIMMVGNNFASALSLGGAFAIIRFRSVASDPKDIVYVLFCMAIGLTGGVGLLLYALFVTIILCLVMVLLQRFKYAVSRKSSKTLRISIPENFNYQSAFDDILQRYATSYTHRRTRTTDLGSLFEITFDLIVPDDIDEKTMIDELRARNGNLPIVLVIGQSQSYDYIYRDP